MSGLTNVTSGQLTKSTIFFQFTYSRLKFCKNVYSINQGSCWAPECFLFQSTNMILTSFIAAWRCLERLPGLDRWDSKDKGDKRFETNTTQPIWRIGKIKSFSDFRWVLIPLMVCNTTSSQQVWQPCEDWCDSCDKPLWEHQHTPQQASNLEQAL